MKNLRLAVDTNVLLDLADEVDDVLDALTVIEQRLPGADRLVPPSVLEELAYLTDHGRSEQIRRSARRAFQQLREKPRFRPLLKLPVAPQRIEELADGIRHRGLVPLEEIHDAIILAETALLRCAMLLTSDGHLRAIEREQLTWLLSAHDLPTPVIATPREIVRKFFR